MSAATFFTNYAAQAQAASRQTGVLASVILAQWADETGYGTSAAFVSGHNYAGVSYGGTVNNFPDEPSGLAAYVKVLNQHNYDAVRAAKGAQAQAVALGASGWAASHYDMAAYNAKRAPSNGIDLLGIISTYNLTRFDTGTAAAGGAPATGPSGPTTTPDSPPVASTFELLEMPPEDVAGVNGILLAGRELADWLAPGQPVPLRSKLVDLIITDGSEVDLSAGEVSQVTLHLADPSYELLAHGVALLGAQAEYLAWAYQVAAVETTNDNGQGGIVLTLRSQGAQRLKQDVGNKTWSGLSPTQVMYSICQAHGLNFVGQGSAEWPTITRLDPTMGGKVLIDFSSGQYLIPESSWALGQRLAAYLGFMFFEAAGTVYFGRPSWLINNMPVVDLDLWQPKDQAYQLLGPPTFRRSVDDLNGLAIIYKMDCATADIPLDHAVGEAIRPGMAVNFAGMPTFEGAYMVNRVRWNFDNGATPVVVSVERPVDPVPQLPADLTGLGLGTGPSALPSTGVAQPARAAGHASAIDFTTIALEMVGDRYQWGAAPDPNDPHPLAFDCSALVQWAAARVGVRLPRFSGDQWLACSTRSVPVATAMRIRGALLWVDTTAIPGGQHVAISLGDGKTVVEALNTRLGVGVFPETFTPFNRAAIIPAMDYGYGVGVVPPA